MVSPRQARPPAVCRAGGCCPTICRTHARLAWEGTYPASEGFQVRRACDLEGDSENLGSHGGQTGCQRHMRSPSSAGTSGHVRARQSPVLGLYFVRVGHRAWRSLSCIIVLLLLREIGNRPSRLTSTCPPCMPVHSMPPGGQAGEQQLYGGEALGAWVLGCFSCRLSGTARHADGLTGLEEKLKLAPQVPSLRYKTPPSRPTTAHHRS